MRYWVQFLDYSTGYIPGTIPPVFGVPALTDALGDTAVFVLDGRNDCETMRRDGLKRAQRLEHWRKYPAFQIVTGPRLFQEAKRGPRHFLTYPIQGA